MHPATVAVVPLQQFDFFDRSDLVSEEILQNLQAAGLFDCDRDLLDFVVEEVSLHIDLRRIHVLLFDF